MPGSNAFRRVRSIAALVTVPIRCRPGLAAILAGALAAWPCVQARADDALLPPQARDRRLPVTVEDLARLRDIDTIAVSHRGDRLALLVRAADPDANSYRTRWHVIRASGGGALDAGDGGEARFIRGADGTISGDLGGSEARWSEGDDWIAYTRLVDGVSALWISDTSSGRQRRISAPGMNIRDFYWLGPDRLVFEGVSIDSHDLGGERSGYSADDFRTFADAIFPGRPSFFRNRRFALFSASARGRGSAPASADERTAFEAAARVGRLRTIGGVEQVAEIGLPSSQAEHGRRAWLQGEAGTNGASYPMVTLAAMLASGQPTLSCPHEACRGPTFAFNGLWLSADRQSAIFWRRWGGNLSGDAIFRWDLRSNLVSQIHGDPDEALLACDADGRFPRKLFCIRETRLSPAKVVELDLASGAERVIFDGNPQFANRRLPRIERFEWQLDERAVALGYPGTAHGYIIYPPGFDPSRKYPAIICPYRSRGFIRGDGGDEQPMLAYAEAGIVVINSEFPVPWGADSRTGRAEQQASLWSRDSFAHLYILADSTFRALDAVERRGFLDSSRIGIGGVSQGAAEPILMLQISDRLRAVSLGSPGNSQLGSYLVPAQLRNGTRNIPGYPPDRDDDYWRPVDLSYHTETIEAPILFNLADSELTFNLRLFRQMDYNQKPYDVYVFPSETHFKWQPAHRLAIYRRNLDWFRFWLQNFSDPGAEKGRQYDRWRQLREQHCRVAASRC
jgi:dipeptidyl aminopeptidase/acylaminoacyl peptidase